MQRDLKTDRPRRRARQAHWYETKRLTLSDGYVILIRVELALWRARRSDPAVQAILDRCRKMVLAELGYAVEPQPAAR
jgi:hypothetical protein